MLGFDMNVIERGVRSLFAREFVTRQRKVKYTRFCSVVDSDKQSEKYNTISTIPQLSEVTDERVVAGFSEYTYELTNKAYMNAIRIPRTLFEFDQTGQIRTLVQSCGSRVANFPDALTFAVMGANGTAYDNVAFAATTHDLGDGTSQANSITSSITDTNLLAASTKTNRDDLIAAFQLDFIKAKAALMALLDDRGQPWHDDAEPEGLLILCNPYMEFYARMAVEAAILQDSSNVAVRSVGAVISTNYNDAFKDNAGTVRKSTWWLFKIDTPLKPFIFQRFGPKTNFPDAIPEADQTVLTALNSVEVQTVMRTGANISEHTFFDDEFLVGARCIYSAGYGMWQNAIKVNGQA